jgi:hypothetical protein
MQAASLECINVDEENIKTLDKTRPIQKLYEA